MHAGRDLSGWNRTVVGEEVTADKVCLGNIFGLSTKPVSFWQKADPWEKSTWSKEANMGHVNTHEIVSRQALSFIAEHVPDMIFLIDWLGARANEVTRARSR